MKRIIKAAALLTAVMLLSGCADFAGRVVNVGKRVVDFAKADIAEKAGVYDNVADLWRNEVVMGDKKAAFAAVRQLLEDADSGSRERFANTFTKKVRDREDFNEKLDIFFENFPAGLSECEIKSTGGGFGTGSVDDGMLYDDYSTSFTCELNGEWFRIGIDFIYHNMADPENAGVTFFRVQNEGGFVQELTEEDYLECLVYSQEEVPTRRIYDDIYRFTPTPDRVITEEEMAAVLRDSEYLSRIEAVFGEPNARTEDPQYITYYYELEPQDGEPRYACIRETLIPKGISGGYVCSDKKRLNSLTEKEN